eukprot:c30231_g1_i1 orf=89-319(+)
MWNVGYILFGASRKNNLFLVTCMYNMCTKVCVISGSTQLKLVIGFGSILGVEECRICGPREVDIPGGLEAGVWYEL